MGTIAQQKGETDGQVSFPCTGQATSTGSGTRQVHRSSGWEERYAWKRVRFGLPFPLEYSMGLGVRQESELTVFMIRNSFLSFKGVTGLVQALVVTFVLLVLGVIVKALLPFRTHQVINQQQQSVTPSTLTTATIGARPPDPMVGWKKYISNWFSVEYPAHWELYKAESGDSFDITDDANSRSNTFRINVREIEPLRELKNLSDEEVIENVKNYEMSSTANSGNYQPRQISRSKTVIDGRKGVEYRIHLDNPEHLKYGQVTWIFVPYKQYLIAIFIGGQDQHTLDQVLSSFKFTQ